MKERLHLTVTEKGTYWGEDMGANTFDVYFLGKPCRKPKRIATAGSLEGILRGIAQHMNTRPHPGFGVVVNIMDL
jgi:hypothetical protein